VPILFPLSDRQLWQLARLLVPKSYAKGQMVFHQGDEADHFYICQRGAFSCFSSASCPGVGVFECVLRVWFGGCSSPL
jgi:CRP-like cAMP-binding protein